MARKPKRVTRREKKAMTRPAPRTGVRGAAHMHCIACGRHIDPWELRGALATATILECRHGGTFPSCMRCAEKSTELIAEHDRTGKAVQAAHAWH